LNDPEYTGVPHQVIMKSSDITLGTLSEDFMIDWSPEGAATVTVRERDG